MQADWLPMLAGLLLGLLLAGLALILLLLRRNRQDCLQLQGQLEQLRLQQQQLASDLAGFQKANIQMGEQLVALRDQLKRTQDRQQQIEQQDPQGVSYNQASRLVGLGASVEDLMQACGVTKAEAELLVKMHAR